MTKKNAPRNKMSPHKMGPAEAGGEPATWIRHTKMPAGRVVGSASPVSLAPWSKRTAKHARLHCLEDEDEEGDNTAKAEAKPAT